MFALLLFLLLMNDWRFVKLMIWFEKTKMFVRCVMENGVEYWWFKNGNGCVLKRENEVEGEGYEG